MNKSHEFPIDWWTEESGLKKDTWLPRTVALLVFGVAGVLSFQRREKVNLLSERVCGYRKHISSSIHSQWICFNEYYKPLLRESNASSTNRSCLPTRSFSTLAPRSFVCIFVRIFFFQFRKESKDCGKKVANTGRICGKPQWFFDRISKCV